MEYQKGDIISKPIYDKNGRCIGNVTGRRDLVENSNNRDLNDMLRRGDKDHKDNLRR